MRIGRDQLLPVRAMNGVDSISTSAHSIAGVRTKLCESWFCPDCDRGQLKQSAGFGGFGAAYLKSVSKFRSVFCSRQRTVKVGQSSYAFPRTTVIYITSRPTPTQLTARLRGRPRKICAGSSFFALNTSFENDAEMTGAVPRIAASKKCSVCWKYGSAGGMASRWAVAII